MKRVLINPIIQLQEDLSVGELLAINYLKMEGLSSISDVLTYSRETDAFMKEEIILESKYITVKDKLCKLSSDGLKYFRKELEPLSDDMYVLIEELLSVWNGSPHTTTHTLRKKDHPQSKLINDVANILQGIMSGKPHELMKDATFKSDKPITLPEYGILFEDILDVVQEYLLKFNPLFYPRDKRYLPHSLKEFFVSFKTNHSEFWNVYFNGFKKIASEAIDTISTFGVQYSTVNEAYNVLLNSELKILEVEQLKVQNAIIRLHQQWEDLIIRLDKYYLWNKKYVRNIKVFSTFLNIYLSWIDRNITGEKFPAFLQIADNHKVYEQFKAYLADEFDIRFAFDVKYQEYLLRQMEKLKE